MLGTFVLAFALSVWVRIMSWIEGIGGRPFEENPSLASPYETASDKKLVSSSTRKSGSGGSCAAAVTAVGADRDLGSLAGSTTDGEISLTLDSLTVDGRHRRGSPRTFFFSLTLLRGHELEALNWSTSASMVLTESPLDSWMVPSTGSNMNDVLGPAKSSVVSIDGGRLSTRGKSGSAGGGMSGNDGRGAMLRLRRDLKENDGEGGSWTSCVGG
jgi:hypothetical protein